MKVAHVVKRIEMIDDDVKQLKKLTHQLKKGKKYANPIIMSIEKQINILLAERIKYLDLKIENPPAFMNFEADDREEQKLEKPAPARVSRLKTRKRDAASESFELAKDSSDDSSKDTFKDSSRNSAKTDKRGKGGGYGIPLTVDDDEEDFDILTDVESDQEVTPMLTQEMIDAKFEQLHKNIMKSDDREKKK